MIYGWTKDENGNIIGDFPGEELCSMVTDFGCGAYLYWSSGRWRPEDNASKLAREVNKRPIGKVVAATYGASVVAAAFAPVIEACAANPRACAALVTIGSLLAEFVETVSKLDHPPPSTIRTMNLMVAMRARNSTHFRSSNPLMIYEEH